MPKYLITNGIKYLRQNKQGDYYLVNKNDATVWNTYKQALNALNNGIGKQARDAFYVEKPSKSTDPQVELQKLIEADTSDFNRWLSSISNFKRFASTLDTKRSDLVKELSDVDEEICDILHYIEFGRLNASQGWAAAEMMKLSRQRRRKIKDALYIIYEIQKGRRDNIPESECAKKAIFNLNHRQYTPRKLSFLFEGYCNIHC